MKNAQFHTPPLPEAEPWHVLLLRGVVLGLLVLVLLGLLGITGGLAVYAYYARTLPSPQELYTRRTPFETTRIFDRHGRLLYEIIDPQGGRRIIVPYKDLPQVLIDATVATEDETFFSNPGVNPFSIARALYMNLREREIVQGGSTITQQVVKNLFLTPEQTLSRKIKEAILAAEITRRYSKEEILEIYLNDVYFGNLAYGIGAAAETYFGKHPSQLTLPEAALLVGLLQGPAIYDPYTNPEGALARRATVLRLMLAQGYINQEQFQEAMATPLTLQPLPQSAYRAAPHWVNYVRTQLEAQYGANTLYRGGLQVYTTLDLDLQRMAEQIVREKIVPLRDRNANNAALVAMDPHTGEILAMVGSVDFDDPTIDGQVNVAIRPRQPGSTIKPLTYLAAFERLGWSPSTMLMDVKQSFPDGANPPYVPTNFDGKEWGPISLRVALASSRNIPAVYTLYQVGIPTLLEVAQRLGINSLNRTDYGLSLTLGGGEVTLLEMTTAYAAFANGGYRVEPQSILYIRDHTGQLILAPREPSLTRVMDPRHAYFINDILSDNEARSRAFGPNSALRLDFPAAAKTGTTNDYRDCWTIGYTPQLVTGVWVGNNDYRPTDRLTGSKAAAPIWKAFMEQALAGQPHPDFERPAGLVEVEVCPVSGQRHTTLCPDATKALFLEENQPEECSVHRMVKICQASGELATENCPPDILEERYYEDYGPEWDAWMQQQGLPIPPRETCHIHTQPIRVTIQAPSQSEPIVLRITGAAQVADFSHYYVEYGYGLEPVEWYRIIPDVHTPVRDGVLCSWDTRTLPEGDYSLRLVVFDTHGRRYEARAQIHIIRSASPSLTPTWTPSPTIGTLTPTLVPTATFTPSPTASPSPTATETPTPSATPTASATIAPTATATLTPSPWPTATPTLAPSTTPSPSPTEATIEPTGTPQPSP